MHSRLNTSPLHPLTARRAVSAALAVVTVLLGLGSVLGTLVSNAATANAGLSTLSNTPGPEATAALDWLSTQLTANGNALPGFSVGTSAAKPDWGLSADALLGFIAAGRADEQTPQLAANRLFENLSEFTTYEPEIAGVRLAGPTAKLLLISESLGRTPQLGPGITLEQELRSLMVTAGSVSGRFADRNPSSSDPVAADSNNGFGQALAILALSRTESGVPTPAVEFLLAQQCPNGGFRLIYSATPGCVSNARSDTDSTAVAIQALLAADRTPAVSAALSAAASWLLSQQDPGTGGFGGSGSTAALNANSTGLSAQALRAAGQVAAADRAALWITSSLQLNGAIAYTPTARAAAIASGIPSYASDQWRRATAQAVLGLGLPPFAPAVQDSPPEVSTVPPTTVPPTTVPPTTSEVPTISVPAAQTPTASPPTEVLGAQSSAQQLALTGSQTQPLILLAAFLITLGITLAAADKSRWPWHQNSRIFFFLAVAALLAASALHAPEVAANQTALKQATVNEAACEDSSGVTVIIDFQELGRGITTRCVASPISSGFAVLTAAGINYQTATRSPGFLCKIAGMPSTDPCIQPSPTTAYWSYWLANRGGAWCYSSLGAGNILPPAGSVQGWSFSLNRTDSDAAAPRATPPAALPGAVATTSVGGGCDSPVRTTTDQAQATKYPATPDPVIPAASPAIGAAPAAIGAEAAAAPAGSTAAPTAPAAIGAEAGAGAGAETATSSTQATADSPTRESLANKSSTKTREQSGSAALELNQQSTPRSSPLGPILAGLLLAGLGAGAILQRRRATRS